MNLSYQWLESMMDLDGYTPEQVAQQITKAGFEVEAITPLSQADHIVIGEVLTCDNHPDSDHLHITTVNIGQEILPIVCGAPNVAAGQKVLVAKVGARLPKGEIKATTIRQQESRGMICSLPELGVEGDASGIEVLAADAPVGEDGLAYLGLDDTILDISLTPNRADCQSAFSMALEIGAILNRQVSLPEVTGIQGGPTKAKVQSLSENCPYFLLKVIGSIKIKESPEWIKRFLRANGMHSTNNVVDISNVVMLETGQPMHFYDRNSLSDDEITVRDDLNIVYEALDENQYCLQSGDLVITSGQRPVGIAGIMGGQDSKITEKTTSLVLECAQFKAASIRNTARRLNIASQASLRYQRGIALSAADLAMNRAVDLLVQYAQADGIEQTVVAGQSGIQPVIVKVDSQEINHRLGTDFTQEQMVDVLERLRFEPKVLGQQIICTIPSDRWDIEGMADISEEIIRILGFDALPIHMPELPMTEGKLDERQRLLRQVERYMVAQGFRQAVTYTLVSQQKEDAGVLSVGHASALMSPISAERALIRTSILPSLLEAAGYNVARNQKNVRLFELSELFSENKQADHLALVLSGPLQASSWSSVSKEATFYDVKGLLVGLLEALGISSARLSYQVCKQANFHPGMSADLYLDQNKVASFGRLHPEQEKNLGFKGFALELDLSQVIETKRSKVKYQPLSRYPEVQRDFALWMDRDLSAASILSTIEANGKLGKERLLRQTEIFDQYPQKPNASRHPAHRRPSIF